MGMRTPVHGDPLTRTTSVEVHAVFTIVVFLFELLLWVQIGLQVVIFVVFDLYLLIICVLANDLFFGTMYTSLLSGTTLLVYDKMPDAVFLHGVFFCFNAGHFYDSYVQQTSLFSPVFL